GRLLHFGRLFHTRGVDRDVWTGTLAGFSWAGRASRKMDTFHRCSQAPHRKKRRVLTSRLVTTKVDRQLGHVLIETTQSSQQAGEGRRSSSKSMRSMKTKHDASVRSSDRWISAAKLDTAV